LNQKKQQQIITQENRAA